MHPFNFNRHMYNSATITSVDIKPLAVESAQSTLIKDVRTYIRVDCTFLVAQQPHFTQSNFKFRTYFMYQRKQEHITSHHILCAP